MSTVYTLNGKVLKNAANDKWLIKKEAPAGFVMNATNAIIQSNTANWEGPNYPSGYDGEGKTLQIIVKEEGFTCYALRLDYTDRVANYGSVVIVGSNGSWINPNSQGGSSPSLPVGTYNLTMIHNSAGGNTGKYITLHRIGSDNTINTTLLSKIEFRIID